MYNSRCRHICRVFLISESRRLLAHMAKSYLAMDNTPHEPCQRNKEIQQPERETYKATASRSSETQMLQAGKQILEGVPNSQPTTPISFSHRRPSISIEQTLSKTKIKAIAKAYRAAEREKRLETPNSDKAQPVAGAAVSNFNNLVTNLDDPTIITSLPLRHVHTRSQTTKVPENKTKMASPGKPFGVKNQDPRVAPSTASGGIPNATAAYRRAASFVPMLMPEPQNLMVVIDLNGTILYRPSRTNPKKFVERPNARRFLQYCVDTFTVVIWSSAKDENVNAMCRAFLTGELAGKVTAIWGRTKLGLSPGDFNLRVQVYKRLTTLWNDPQIMQSHPDFESGGRWNQSNTVLIDDSLEKARSEPFNLIEVPEYFGDVNEQSNILPQVHDYINWLSCHSNVSSCIRSRPFKAITQGIPVTPNVY